MVVKMRDEETIWSEFVPAVSDGGSSDESMEELIPGYLVTSVWTRNLKASIHSPEIGRRGCVS